MCDLSLKGSPHGKRGFKVIEQWYVPQRHFSETPKWSNRPPRALIIQRRNAWKAYKQVRREFGRTHELSVEA